MRRSHSKVAALALVAAVGLAGEAKAGPITDPAGDFLPTYTGSKTGAYDVLIAGGTFDGTTFHLFATLAGPVSGSPGTPLYVWGINTGTGVNNFANVNNANVTFNRVFTLNAAAVTSNVSVTGFINGRDVGINVPLSILTSTGFAPQDFLWNLWPRDTSAPAGAAPVGTASAISDFAPDNAVARFDIIPEPATLVVFGAVAAAGALGSRRRKATARV